MRWSQDAAHSLAPARASLLSRTVRDPFQCHLLSYLTAADLARLACTHPVLAQLVRDASPATHRGAAMRHLGITSPCFPSDSSAVQHMLYRHAEARQNILAGRLVTDGNVCDSIVMQAPSEHAHAAMCMSSDGSCMAVLAPDQSQVTIFHVQSGTVIWTSDQQTGHSVASVGWWEGQSCLSMVMQANAAIGQQDSHSLPSYYCHVDCTNKHAKPSMMHPLPHGSCVPYAWSPCGRRLALCQASSSPLPRQVIIWDTVSHARLAVCSLGSSQAAPPAQPTLLWAPDGAFLAVHMQGGSPQDPLIFDLRTGAARAPIVGNMTDARAPETSDSAGWGGQKDEVAQWLMQQAAAVRAEQGPCGGQSSASLDGSPLSCTSEGSCSNAATATELARPPAKPGCFRSPCVAVSTDGRMRASAVAPAPGLCHRSIIHIACNGGVSDRGCDRTSYSCFHMRTPGEVRALCWASDGTALVVQLLRRSHAFDASVRAYEVEVVVLRFAA